MAHIPLRTGADVLNLVNNVASLAGNALSAVGSWLGRAPNPTYPVYEDQGITAKYQRNQWFDAPSQGFYAFSVEKVGGANISQFPKFIQNISNIVNTIKDAIDLISGKTPMKWDEFVLPINPQEITQVEDFAVSLKPTQGGTVVNHSGNKYKTLTISGTTGVMPGRNYFGVLKPTGQVIGTQDIPENQSGYEVFLHFRNWIKSYHEAKAAPGNETLRMLWRNYKDWEFLFVEPIKFTMKRDAQKPLLYNYTISFRVTGIMEIKKPLYEQVIQAASEIAAFAANSYALMQKNQDASTEVLGIIKGIIETCNNIKMAIRAADRKTPTAGDLTGKTIAKLSTRQLKAVLDAFNKLKIDAPKKHPNVPIQSPDIVGDAAKDEILVNSPTATPAAIAGAITETLKKEPELVATMPITDLPKTVQDLINADLITAVSTSKQQFVDMRSQITKLSDQLSAKVGLGNVTYNIIFNNVTATTTALTAASAATAAAATATLTDERFEMLKALSDMKKVLDGVLSGDTITDTLTNTYKQNIAVNSPNSIGTGIFAMPSANTGMITIPLPNNTTLQDIAGAVLGDTAQWTVLAELNNLKAPYIDYSRQVINTQATSLNYSDPGQIRNPQIGDVYAIPSVPTPTGAWSGKANYLATYMGGVPTITDAWIFAYPDDGQTIQVISTGDLYQWSNITSTWSLTDNNLASRDGILRPGDLLKIPSGSNPITSTLQGPRDNVFTNNMTPSEASLGVDLKLTAENDLYLTPAGDLGVAAGADNGAQIIVQRILIEKGAWKKYPDLGTDIVIGGKMPTLAVIRNSITTSLLQDPRIADVRNFNIVTEGSTINLAFDVVFFNINKPIPITIPV